MIAQPTAPRTPLSMWLGWASGFALAIVASGGILAQRISHGDVRTALIGHLLLTAAVLLAARVSSFSPSRIAQLVGGAVGIMAAHAVFHESSLSAIPWLSEHPAQLVNDAVAVFAPLAIVHAATSSTAEESKPRTAVVLTTLVLVTVYRATATRWHLDGGVFTLRVQDFVTGEFAGASLSVAIFRGALLARC